MSSNKKYYWLKLRSDFFEDPIIDIMSSLPDGDKVQLIYIRLLLKSLKENGYICLPGLLPTMEEELAKFIGQDVTITKYALNVLEKANLLERGSEDWDLCMTKLPEMVGSETAAAARMRNLREKRAIEAKQQKTLPDQGNIVTSCSPVVTECYRDVQNCYPEIEKETKIDTESEKEAYVENSSPKYYGVNENVILSDAEYESLKRIYPDYLAKIDYFSTYLINTGKHYGSHYFTIMQWARQDDLKRPRQEKKSGFPDYSFEEGESY